MNRDEQLKTIYDARTQKARDDRDWAFRPTCSIPASNLKVGDAVYDGNDGTEFLVLEISPVGMELEITVGSGFSLVQPKPYRLSPSTLVVASPL